MRIYFMSICGTGMGNGALLMQSLGHTVSGADQNTYPPMSDRLRESGIDIMEGYDAERLRRLNPDLVVVGNVNTRGNPEVEWLLDSRELPFTSLPELLSRELLAARKSIVVAGTHGKTTTTTLAAHLLVDAGVDPGYLIGGVPNGLPSGAHAGSSEAPFVIEGDEYDSAFFDKRSKFIHYCPNILVLNNLEFDHADIFRDLQDVGRSFTHLIKLVPQSGWIVANSDDPAVEELLHVDWSPVRRVGLGERADLRIMDFGEDERGSSFNLVYRGTHWARIEWPVWGLYNARNAAMASLACALALSPKEPLDFNPESLNRYAGVKRRQEVLAADAGRCVLTDFAHHPTAIRETLRCLRARFPDHHLMVCFEARSNTACRKIHETAFELTFDEADEVFLGEVFRPERYPESDRIDLPMMAVRLGPKATAHARNRDLGDAVKRRLAVLKKAVVVFFSNGSFDGVPQRVADWLNGESERPGLGIDAKSGTAR